MAMTFILASAFYLQLNVILTRALVFYIVLHYQLLVHVWLGYVLLISNTCPIRLFKKITFMKTKHTEADSFTKML